MRPPSRLAGRHGLAAATLTLALATVVAGCSGPILANPPAARPTPPTTPTPSQTLRDPLPIVFPAADGPHHRLTEWWYYTGHLVTDSGHRYGFELVVFRAERGPLPVTWASHLALTDETGNAFHYAQRSEIGPQVDRSPRDANGVPTGFDLSVTSFLPNQEPAPPAWTMAGSDGHDHLTAALSPAEARTAGLTGLAFDLTLASRTPPVLEGGSGWIDFGGAGSTYYYSRPSMAVTGTLTVDGQPAHVTGEAWFDHQWGDFIAVGSGGWDWFAINLADGTAVMLSLIRAADGAYPLEYGTLVHPDGTAQPLARTDFTVAVTGHWTSLRTGTTYPAAWTIGIPGQGLRIELSPTVADQELDTRATTGVVYWEGSQRVAATRDGRPLGGQAYVELTGYGPPK